MASPLGKTEQPRLDGLRSVLIIDDDEDDIFIIEDRLSDLVSSECNYVNCKDKDQAIEHLKTNKYDLCLLDHRLGYFEGIEILKALDDQLITTPIIMLTGQDDERIETLAIRSGAQDYIMKSAIDTEVFAKSIRYAVSRKELEFARISNERFRSENVAKDKFIAHLSHELRTPLTSILGYTSLLLENDIAAPLQKELSIINNNGKHLLNLLNDVLDLSKIAAGKFELQNGQCNLHKLMAQVYSLLSVNAMDKGLEFECTTTTAINKTVILDELRVKQVLINLLGNAIKFTDSGRVSLTLSQNENNQLIAKVSDSGIGMYSEQVEKIFAPFTQIEDVADRKAGGAGLGLSISAEILKQMGGTIDVHSDFGQGTTFTVMFPFGETEDKSREHLDFELQKNDIAQDECPRLSGRVLIVDDVFEIRQLVGQYVKQTGCEVEYARNGSLALERFEQVQSTANAFNLVLLDLHMPVMTGQEAIAQFKSIKADIPIIAITAAIQKGTRQSLFDLGFSELLSKPIERERLFEVLEDLLPPAQESEQSAVGTKHICLVEDDHDTANIMRILLTKLQHKVTHYADASSCLDGLSNHPESCLLLDLGLPDMPAEQFVQAVRAKSPEADIYILSGSEVSKEFIQEHSIKGHLLKPVSLEQLRQFF
jgi:signal transduction histidine kinase